MHFFLHISIISWIRAAGARLGGNYAVSTGQAAHTPTPPQPPCSQRWVKAAVVSTVIAPPGPAY